jgi:hypothetical protein
MAIPPNMRRFLVVANWPRVVVRTSPAGSVRSLILPGEETADPQLRAIWDASNLSAHTKMFRRDKLIYGRGVHVGRRERADRNLPLVRVESPREIEALVDTRREEMTAAAGSTAWTPTASARPNVTLYLPESTIWVAKGTDGPLVRGRPRQPQSRRRPDRHAPQRAHVGRVRGRVGTDRHHPADRLGLPVADEPAVRQEAHGIPRMYMTGVEQGDFVDATASRSRCSRRTSTRSTC